MIAIPPNFKLTMKEHFPQWYAGVNFKKENKDTVDLQISNMKLDWIVLAFNTVVKDTEDETHGWRMPVLLID